MWRVIMISFAFMAVAFYLLSGGADYAPAPDSLQVARRDKPLFAPPRKTDPKVTVIELTGEDAPAESADSQQAEPPDPAESDKTARRQTSFTGLSGFDGDAHDGFEMRRDASSSGLGGGQAMGTRALDRVGTFSAETLVQDVRDTPIDQALIAAPQPADTREVTGNNANMRSGPGTDFDKIAELAPGAKVEVLDRRGAWVKLRDLRTGATGWMADWLVTTAN